MEITLGEIEIEILKELVGEHGLRGGLQGAIRWLICERDGRPGRGERVVIDAQARELRRRTDCDDASAQAR